MADSKVEGLKREIVPLINKCPVINAFIKIEFQQVVVRRY